MDHHCVIPNISVHSYIQYLQLFLYLPKDNMTFLVLQLLVAEGNWDGINYLRVCKYKKHNKMYLKLKRQRKSQYVAINFNVWIFVMGFIIHYILKLRLAPLYLIRIYCTLEQQFNMEYII